MYKNNTRQNLCKVLFQLKSGKQLTMAMTSKDMYCAISEFRLREVEVKEIKAKNNIIVIVLEDGFFDNIEDYYNIQVVNFKKQNEDNIYRRKEIKL